MIQPSRQHMVRVEYVDTLIEPRFHLPITILTRPTVTDTAVTVDATTDQPPRPAWRLDPTEPLTRVITVTTTADQPETAPYRVRYGSLRCLSVSAIVISIITAPHLHPGQLHLHLAPTRWHTRGPQCPLAVIYQHILT